LVVRTPGSLIIDGRYLGHYLKIGLVGAVTEVYDGVAEQVSLTVLGAPNSGAPLHGRPRLAHHISLTMLAFRKSNLLQNFLKIGESVLVVHLELVSFELF